MKRIPAFKELAPILIVTEDKKSARDYLLSRIKDLGLTHIQVRVVPSTGSSPDKVVETAINLCEKQQQNSEKKGELPFSKVFCVMDVDNHDLNPDHNKQPHQLRKAIDRLQSSQKCHFVRIVSNECFEVWYVLHFKQLGDTKPIRRPRKSKINIPDEEHYEKILKKNGIDYSKSIEVGESIFEKLRTKEEQALKNASWLITHHANYSQNPPGYYANPSTEVHLLITELKEMAKRYEQTVPEITMLSNDITIQDLPQDVIKRYWEELVLELVDIINEVCADATLNDKKQIIIDILDKEYQHTFICHQNCSERLSIFYWDNIDKQRVK
jgi:RloB-like protein